MAICVIMVIDYLLRLGAEWGLNSKIFPEYNEFLSKLCYGYIPAQKAWRYMIKTLIQIIHKDIPIIEMENCSFYVFCLVIIINYLTDIAVKVTKTVVLG